MKSDQELIEKFIAFTVPRVVARFPNDEGALRFAWKNFLKLASQKHFISRERHAVLSRLTPWIGVTPVQP